MWVEVSAALLGPVPPVVLAIVCDGGTIINTKAARSQIQGAVVMGIGQALLEATELDHTARFTNSYLASYLVPVPADIPPIDVRFLDRPDGV